MSSGKNERKINWVAVKPPQRPLSPLQGCSKVAAKPLWVRKFSGFLPKAATTLERPWVRSGKASGVWQNFGSLSLRQVFHVSVAGHFMRLGQPR
jgi:hypothetical protein